MIDDTPYLLIADDNKDVREMVAFGVRARGWYCETAETPKQIIDAVKSHCEEDDSSKTCFDALICDIQYEWQEPDEPRRTGVSAIRELRKQFKNLPVIFITARDNSRILRNEALSVGQELIAKPFEVDYLLNRAKIWMDWMRPNKFEGHDRRRYGMNRSGLYRRATDTQEESGVA
jgi:DNA-binding response OmpR family regulator